MIFGASIIWIIADLKQEVTASLETVQTAVTEANQAVATVNANLPEIVTEVKKGTGVQTELDKKQSQVLRTLGVSSTKLDSKESSVGVKSEPCIVRNSVISRIAILVVAGILATFIMKKVL